MLQLLTDEHIAPAVAAEVGRKCADLSIVALRDWLGGHLLGAADDLLLAEARRHGLTLVTYDVRTIPPLLRSWAELGVAHAGVVLVDQRTIKQQDIGAQVTALSALWEHHGHAVWTNRVVRLL